MKINFKQLTLYFDNYNINNLIKKIDENYRLYFDNKNKDFIILNIANNNEVCLKTKEVDSRILNRLQKTSITKSKQIFKEIDEHNKKLKDAAINLAKQKSIDSAVEISRYAKRANQITNKEINKIKEGKYA